tara:strand:- start:7576 stop:8169 length:594 start_codon:yes stop_codon:yes gene_type:complete
VAKSLPLGLIVGLGNPGDNYTKTRHNAGFWLIDSLAQRYSVSFRSEARFKAQVCRIRLGGRAIWLLKPDAYMNQSGPSVSGWASYYKLRAEQTLVVHDELNLPCGRVSLKRNGGHGGHNGLRDIISHLNANFVRARIGIGYPDSRYDVANYVLNAPSTEDLRQISRANAAILENIETIVAGDFEAAMESVNRSLSRD